MNEVYECTTDIILLISPARLVEFLLLTEETSAIPFQPPPPPSVASLAPAAEAAQQVGNAMIYPMVPPGVVPPSGQVYQQVVPAPAAAMLPTQEQMAAFVPPQSLGGAIPASALSSSILPPGFYPQPDAGSVSHAAIGLPGAVSSQAATDQSVEDGSQLPTDSSLSTSVPAPPSSSSSAQQFVQDVGQDRPSAGATSSNPVPCLADAHPSELSSTSGQAVPLAAVSWLFCGCSKQREILLRSHFGCCINLLFHFSGTKIPMFPWLLVDRCYSMDQYHFCPDIRVCGLTVQDKVEQLKRDSDCCCQLLFFVMHVRCILIYLYIVFYVDFFVCALRWWLFEKKMR